MHAAQSILQFVQRRIWIGHARRVSDGYRLLRIWDPRRLGELWVDPSVGPAMEAAGIAAGRLFSNKKESEKKDAYSISPKADLDKELRKQERMLVVFIDDLDRLSSEEIRLVFRIVTLLLIFLRLFMCSRLIVVWYQER